MSLTGKKTHLVNIPRDVNDVFYRYKMPSIVTKVDGRGNHFRTTLVNLKDVAQALVRPPSYIIKFIGYELGVPTCTDENSDKWILKGKHDLELAIDLLDDFIDKFVLCKTCRLPETDLVLARGGKLKLSCRACGHIYQADNSHKLASFIQKNPPQTSKAARSGKTAVADRPTELHKFNCAPDQHVDDADEDDWAVDTSAEAVEKRRTELLGPSFAK